MLVRIIVFYLNTGNLQPMLIHVPAKLWSDQLHLQFSLFIIITVHNYERCDRIDHELDKLCLKAEWKDPNRKLELHNAVDVAMYVALLFRLFQFEKLLEMNILTWSDLNAVLTGFWACACL